jgi:arabinogalactan oligomer/maltooligosaccharide transport system permease protein
MHRLAGFTGLPAQILKIVFMALADASLVAMFFASLAKHGGLLTVVIAIIFIVLNIVYFSPRSVPLKFLLPGLILLVTFVVVPVAYTIQMSAFNYRTGNEISQPDALTQIMAQGLQPDAANTSYDFIIGRVDGKLAGLVTNQADNSSSLATTAGMQPLAAADVVSTGGKVTGAKGFTPLTPDEAANLDSTISTLKFPDGNGSFISPQGDVAILLKQSYIYDSKKKTITDTINGDVYKDNGVGNFADVKDSTRLLQPGWKAFNYFQNYTHLFTDPAVRVPFIGVFIWTTVFAFTTVIMMFSVGLLLAIVLNQKLRFRRFYRSILILPYAIPSFMSILIWGGMFNRQYGAINALFHTNIDWFNSPWLARATILIVNLWLGFPYFYLVSSGALQAIPSELEEAAAIDGAKTSTTLRLIKLPLLLQILSPLLISSFAFNFNNFNIVYLLTGGGPTDVLHGKTAGATDILITYTYKTAFGSNEQNLGLACAISVLIFFVIGSISMWSLKRSKVLEQI